MTKFKGQALNFNIIVKDVSVENKTESGFTLTSEVDANEKQKRGVIVSVGHLCPKENRTFLGVEIPFMKKPTVKVGDEILFDKYKSTALTLEGVPYSILYYSDLVLCF